MSTRARRAARLSTLLLALAAPAAAQLITIRTVPVAQGDQFAMFPSHNLGMGGVSLALADTLLDPFSNPATGARLGAPRFLGSPAFYNVSSDAGGGRTLPLGAFTRSGPWYGGLWVALQEVDASRQPSPGGPIFLQDRIAVDPNGLLDGVNARSHGNTFVFATTGKVLAEQGLSLAGSVLWSGLHAVDGVDMLYAGSEGVRQRGHDVDARLGLLKEWEGGRSLEAVLLHDRFAMTQDVTYLEFFWDPATQQTLQRARLERNLDQTNTWGVHVAYQRPLAAAGWRLGWLATVNRMTHPKIPNYEIMSIPRDPGESYALNLGLGLSRSAGGTTFGVDALYEPIWSYTWADAVAPITTVLGSTIPAGGKTIENRFRFSNGLFRMGVTQELGRAGTGARAPSTALQLGVVARAIGYRLAQTDNVQAARRTLRESWVEWTPTWGLSFRGPALEIRYRGRVTNGTGRPGVGGIGRAELDNAAGGGRGILIAPSGPLTLDEVRVVTHQVTLSLPLH